MKAIKTRDNNIWEYKHSEIGMKTFICDMYPQRIIAFGP